MKSLQIKYITELNDIKISDAAEFFEFNLNFEKIDRVNWFTQYPYKPKCLLKICRSSTSLFIHFKVKEKYIKAKYYQDQKPVWEDSCVEFFCKKAEEAVYYNFEFNCIGTCLATKRKERYLDVQHLSASRMNAIKRYASLGNNPFEEKIGNFEWKLTIEIPFNIMDIQTENLPEILLANFYKCGDETSVPHYLSWNRINTEQPDFHQPAYFGIMHF